LCLNKYQASSPGLTFFHPFPIHREGMFFYWDPDVVLLMGSVFSKPGRCSVFDVPHILVKGIFSDNFSELTKINYHMERLLSIAPISGGSTLLCQTVENASHSPPALIPL
jgi:hypothetical protein